MADLSFWRLASGIEIDFIVNQMELAAEAKATRRITPDHLRGLRNLHTDHPDVENRIVICLEEKERRTEDGIWILPARSFCTRLWLGEWF